MIVFTGWISYCLILLPCLFYALGAVALERHLIDVSLWQVYLFGFALPHLILGVWAYCVNQKRRDEAQQTIFFIPTEFIAILFILVFGFIHFYFPEWKILKFIRDWS